MKNKIEYIILGAMVCVFSFSVIALNNNLNEDTVATSSTALPNKKIGWGIKRNNNHEQPDLGNTNKKIIDSAKGIAMGGKDSKKVYLNYLYNSLDIDMIINRVNYYMRQTQTPKDDILAEEVNVYISQYNLELKKYLSLDNYDRKCYNLVDRLNPILAQISSVIGKMVTRFYARRISIGAKDKITVLDAVNYELSLNTEYSIDTTLVVDDKITMTLSRNSNRVANKEKIIRT